jgi:hypothetical protein
VRAAGELSIAVIAMALGAAAGCGSPSGPPTTSPPPPLTWSLATSPPAPAGLTGLSLDGVACDSATDCWAVGSGQDASGNSQAVIEQLTVAGWSLVTGPTPPGSSFSVLEGVSCTAAGTCWAAGYDVGSEGTATTLIEEQTGSGWTIVASPAQPAGEAGFLNAVTCDAAGDCWAAGSVDGSDGNSGTLVEEETGGGWSIVPTPVAPSGVTSELDAVSCADPAYCWASGDLVDASGAVQVLTLEDTGSGWTVVTSPSASDDEPSSLGTVTCVSHGDCWAAGEFDDATGTAQPLLEHEGGSGWSIVSSPLPSGATGGQLSALTCLTATECWAVGEALTASGAGRPLIERDSGAGWVIQAGPAGPGSTSNQLSAISCVSASLCWGVGSETASKPGSGPALIEEGT